MNKTMKLLSLILALFAAMALVSCGEIDENAPEGCVEISADGVGYNFYMVKDWLVMEQSGITSAKVSDFDPSNVSVMGFDDIPFAGAVLPPLTTIHYPAQEAGKLAAIMLMDSIQSGEKQTELTLSLTPTLVLRDSVAPPHI